MNSFEGWTPSRELLAQAEQLRKSADRHRALVMGAIHNARESYCAQWIELNPNEWTRDWVLREDIQFFQDELITKFWMVRL